MAQRKFARGQLSDETCRGRAEKSGNIITARRLLPVGLAIRRGFVRGGSPYGQFRAKKTACHHLGLPEGGFVWRGPS